MMTLESSGLWSWTAPDGKVPTMIIFNGGGDDTKTGDLKFVNGATYKCDGTYVQNPTVGIDTVETVEEAPIYYNMQGVRVDNPTSGLYIKVTGRKIEKVVVR